MSIPEDPFLGLTMPQVANLSSKDYRFFKAIQKSNQIEAKERRRIERNAKIEARIAKRQSAEPSVNAATSTPLKETSDDRQ